MLAIIGIFAVKTYAEGGTEAQIADEKTLVRMMALVSKGNDSNNKVNINTFFSGYEGVTTAAISSDVIQVTIAETGNIYQVNVNTAAIIGEDTSTNYTITYNANGGTGAPPAQIVAIGETITLSSTEPTREGFSFLGWSTSASATTATYASGGEYTGNTNIILYAVWEGNEYTITYNANGGTGAPEEQTAIAGETVTLSTTVPTREGYAFLGWSTSSSATSAEYEAGASYIGTINVRLYAVWESEEVTYTITYNANGGTGGPEVQTAIAGESTTLSSTKPTRTGYTFLGWATSSSATSAEYTAGGSYTGSADVTLYAVWEQDEYRVTYDLNGGTIAGTSNTTITSGTTYYYGDTVTVNLIHAEDDGLTKSGYTFAGWKNSLNGETYQYGDTFTCTGNVTLKAVWQAESTTYTITFKANGGYFGGSAALGITTQTETVTAGDSFTISSPPKKTGSTFAGWTTSEGVVYANLTTITPTSDMTLTAKWTPSGSSSV